MNRLKKERRNAGLTQKELGELVGITKDYVSILETEKQTPSLALARELSLLFNKSIEYLFFSNDSNDMFQNQNVS